ncbi:MAG: pyridoxal-dependent decarboxylase, exosortase A system-associated [Sutterellaceae bacterium]|nr:pyridoxal-dependent decarboxylase, exosortase A system-associated [Burkholderiaceae bacterium]MDW8430984.1 pyridoxal-dependent decarboxylase, exosortase A system-associated [Sutterellaceae bacterium]
MNPERRLFAAFPVEHDELLVGGVPVAHLAARVGRTPFYAYDRGLIHARVQKVREVLQGMFSLHYAVKANPMPALVAFMAGVVDGFDVASLGELRVALNAGMPSTEISFAGPGKRAEELEAAVAAGILINVESLREIRLLEGISARLGYPARVAVRVNPDFELKASGMKMGGGPKQFGIDAEQVPEALAEIGRCGLAFEGFHIFSGSQNLRAAAICEAQNKAYELALRLAAYAPAPVKVLNLGGGFGIPYFAGDTALDLPAVAEAMAALAARAQRELPAARLVIELGRYLVGEAGIYVCRVLDRKVSRGETFLITDGGMHHHLAASGNFGQVIRRNYPLCNGRRVYGAPRETVNVVGPLCTPLDLLGDRVELGRAEEGDLIVVAQSGAYGYTASPLRFLSHPEPVEVLA